MALIVKKFGGSSLASLDNIKKVAEKIIAEKKQGHQIVVVVSAMFGETDKLESMALDLSNSPCPRELDVLLSTGEQVSIALLSMALKNLGCPAKSYTGSQIKIKTNNVHNKARIESIDVDNIKKDLDEGLVVVVAGFQGIDQNNNITTLGRGGSDTTAVALAAALNASECRIFTDVDGVYTSDPRIVDSANRMESVSFEEMLELSSLGAKVLQIRSVEFAGRYNVPLRVLSTFNPDSTGTLISYDNKNMEHRVVAGIAYTLNEAKIVIRGVKDNPGVAAQILKPLSDENIEVDMIVQNMSKDGTTDFAFTINRKDINKTKKIIEKISIDLNTQDIDTDINVAKISLVGIGIKSNTGIASKMFSVLGENKVNIQLISTSEIKVSVIIDEKYVELALRALHDAFGLEKKLKNS